MNTGEWIAAIAAFIMAIALFLLSIRHFMNRGFLLNNAYLYASKEERDAMDKKPYYRQSAVVFCLLGIAFAIVGLSVVLHNDKLFALEAMLVVGAVIYAVISSVQIKKRAKK